jgi:hypothetical protein
MVFVPGKPFVPNPMFVGKARRSASDAKVYFLTTTLGLRKHGRRGMRPSRLFRLKTNLSGRQAQACRRVFRPAPFGLLEPGRPRPRLRQLRPLLLRRLLQLLRRPHLLLPQRDLGRMPTGVNDMNVCSVYYFYIELSQDKRNIINKYRQNGNISPSKQLGCHKKSVANFIQ